jgi:potassium-dependent mechanosensitive channel
LRHPLRVFARGLSLCVAMVFCTLLGAMAGASAQSVERPSLESIKATVEEIERTVAQEDATAEMLADARQKLNAAADALRANVEETEPRLHEMEERLNQLGPAPEKDEAPESSEIAKERQELTTALSQVEGALKQARVLLVHIDQLSERVAQKRHALYARELFARSASIFDPSFWAQVSRAIPVEISRAAMLLEAWRTEQKEPGRLVASVLILLALAGSAIAFSWRWHARPGAIADTSVTQRSGNALRVFALYALRTPLPCAAAVAALSGLGVLNFRLEQIVYGVLAGVVAACFAHAVARAVFAVDAPEARLVQEDDATARCFHSHLVWASRILGIVIPLQVIHKILFAPLVVTIATNALFGATTAAFLLHLVRRLDRIKQAGGAALPAAAWTHPLGLLLALLILVALVAGYTGFAAFIALRVVVAAAVFGALYLLLTGAKTFFAGFAEPSPRGQKLAASLGITARSIGLSATLLSALARVMLIVVAFVVIIGPWEVSTADLFDTVRNIPFGFKLGELHLSVRAVVTGLLVLIVVLVATRVVQRWLEKEFLPRTRIEPSLQLSIVTIFGYIGAITAIVLGLSGLGFDLQKIALIAGALSVGIGFGLQSIVSNFVSGLILLTERPIRVGDTIVVKGEEGWVRRVRVRTTEIETFDRASVIIPNSELITGVVKNWTRANTLGRIVVKVGVPYDSNPAQVRDMLNEIARGHPQVVQSPPPSAFLVNLGESALDFELCCVVVDVEKSLAVKSDLHYAIIERFRAQRELRWRERGGKQGNGLDESRSMRDAFSSPHSPVRGSAA